MPPQTQQGLLAEQHVAHPQREAELEELGGLELEARDHDPVAVSVGLDTESGHEHEKLEQHGADQRGPRRALPEPDRQAAGDEHERDADHGEHGLLDDRLVGRLTRSRRGRRRRREHHDEAEAGQQQRGRGDQEELARARARTPVPSDTRRRGRDGTRGQPRSGEGGSSAGPASCSPSVPLPIRSRTAAANRRPRSA